MPVALCTLYFLVLFQIYTPNTFILTTIIDKAAGLGKTNQQNLVIFGTTWFQALVTIKHTIINTGWK